MSRLAPPDELELLGLEVPPPTADAATLPGDPESFIAELNEDDSADGAGLPVSISLRALRRLQTSFSLTQFEVDLLHLCASSALEGRTAATRPTFRLCMGSLEGASGDVLSWSRPLRFWNLIEVDDGPLLDAPLRVSDRVMLFLLGVPAMEQRLDGICTPMVSTFAAIVDDASEDAVEQCADHWASDTHGSSPLLLADGSTARRTRLFRLACQRAGLQPWEVHPASLPADAAERARIGRLWAREAVLLPAALLVRAGTAEEMNAVSRWLHDVEAPVAIEAREGLAGWYTAARVTLPAATTATRQAAWHRSLGPGSGVPDQAIADLSESFPMEDEQIATAARAFLGSTPSGDPGRKLRQICRQQARRSMDQLATRVDSRAQWADLVLPEAQEDVLRQMLVQARETHTVHQAWGFAERYQLGLGLAALFAGASGTGKTMAAGILARELDRDLYQIDLSATVSKYIGETEERLRRIFDTAEQSGAILLFDEADALFGKRTQVKDSHDRYANLEVSYLLQRVESYRGIVILTTNMQHAMDAAFVRRLRFVVQFPLPGLEQREKIWRGIFPAAAPVAALDYARLAQLNVPGGVIRNLAFHAAFLAAGEGTTIGMEHLLRSARAEFGKMDRPMNAAELRGWT